MSYLFEPKVCPALAETNFISQRMMDVKRPLNERAVVLQPILNAEPNPERTFGSAEPVSAFGRLAPDANAAHSRHPITFKASAASLSGSHGLMRELLPLAASPS